MESAAERRHPHQTRVPLDNVLVQIAPEGFDETFEADAVNLGNGGLSMRSAILPDIGARLRCRFESPHDGVAVDADCEVVWAEDTGPNLGEFGLKFTEMSTDDTASVEALVHAWHGALDEAGGSETLGRVTLHLHGVGQPVDAELVHRASDALLVEQALPFLEVGTRVDEGGRSGRLESVDLRMDGDTPKLILTIGYADTTPVSLSTSPPMSPSTDAESTLMDAPAPAEPLVPTSGEQAHFDAALDSGPRSEPELVRYDLKDDVALADDDEDLAGLRPSPREKMTAALAASKVHLGKARLWMVAMWARMAPTFRSWWARANHFGGSLARRAGPWMKQLVGRVRNKDPEAKRGKRATRAPKRKTTAPTQGRDAAPRRRFRLRWWLLVAAVGIAVAVVGRADAIEPTSDKLQKPPPADPELGDEPMDVEPVVETQPATEPEPVEVGNVEPEMPRAMPEERRRAGRMPAPSFPSLGEAQRPAAPGTVPAESPYSVDVRESMTQSFGAEAVPNGQQFRIRMSGAIGGLHGEETSDGFTVVVVGTTAAEGARRIANVHTGVERASIDNEGGNATLSVKFTNGQSPAYRVHTRGEALFVTLAP